MFTMVPYRRYLSKPSRAVDTMFNDPFFCSFFRQNETGAFSSFRVDINEKDDNFVIEAEMPGLIEENINLVIDENMLTISADFQREKSEDAEGRRYCERRSGHMERSFSLDNINQDAITAAYRNGVLYVNLPKMKAEEKQVRKISIQTENPRLNEAE